MAPRRRAEAEPPERSQPLAGTRTPGVDHDHGVRPTGHEHIKDPREDEQLAPDLIDPLMGACDVDLMSLHPTSPVRDLCYYVAS